MKERQLRLNKHLQSRKVDKALLQRAWQTTHKIAAMLHDDFGATKVAVFGSLADKVRFSKWSDIDIAVWGIPADKYFSALWQAEEIRGLFKVNLVDFENCDSLFRERIQNQIIYIEQGKIYKVDRNGLFERISDERKKIGETVEKITARLEKIKTTPVEYREEIETTIAKNLVDCYQRYGKYLWANCT